MEQNTNFTFNYDVDDINNTVRINYNSKNASVSDLLMEISKTGKLIFRQVNNTINVRKIEGAGQMIPEIEISIQGRTISGKVTSIEDNSGLPGVNVILKGTSNGTVTDVEGNYSLEVPEEGSVLVFSSVGYLQEEVTVGNQSVIDVVMTLDITSLEEIVVIGYGTQSKRDVTTAVSSIDNQDIQQLAIQSVDQAIQGRVAGVSVTQNSGQPGGNFSVRIRGIGSNRNNEPLYVVDGFPLEGSMGNSFNPDDIESIDILKDAAAAAIYGARGANGVVIITTKRGTAKQTTVDFSMYYGLQQAWNLPEMLNAEEFALLHNEVNAASTIGPNPAWSNPSSLGKGTDWLDEIFRTAPVQEYKVAISGGNEKVQTRLSLGYLNQQGIIISSGFERYSLRINVDYHVNSNIKIGANITPTYRKQDLVPNGEGFSGDILLSAQKMNPTLKWDDNMPTDARWYPQAQMAHPRVLAEQINGNTESFRILANSFAEVTFLKNFRYKLNVGADLDWNKSYTKVPTIVNEGGGIMASYPNNLINMNYGDALTWLMENTLTYDVVIADKHSINALVGYTGQKFLFSSAYSQGSDFLNDEIRSISAGAIRDAGGDLATGWAMESLIGRVSYDFDDKYLFSASIRRDGSSRFTGDNRYGVFPSVSGGWRLSSESFMSGAPFLNDLKLRGSWGQLGNDRIAAFQYLDIYSIGDAFGYTLGETEGVFQGGVLTTLGNPDLTWETSEQYNLGIDLSLFENTLTFSSDYFVKTTKDLLLDRPLPSTVGVSSTFVNAGKVENRGWEFVLGYQNHLGDFNYRVSTNLTSIRNKVLDLNQVLEEGQTEYPPTFITRTYLAGAETESRVGQPFGYYRGYIVDGIIQNEGQIPAHQSDYSPGEFLYRDVNGDQSLNEADIANLGSPFPDFEFGLNLNMDYKGFDFNMFVTAVQGNEVMLVTKRATHRPGTANGWAESLARWNGEGTSNSHPSIAQDKFKSFETPSTWFIEDGSYVRFKNIEFGYTLPKATLDKLSISKLRVYFSGQNLFTITDYPGFDPEIGGSNPLSSGLDIGRYPKRQDV
ncbi:MAG: TonB-dependent receptor [Cyclobacteriaceae bacterium]|nr:TonB-dependent receptor [Cyclobacteriaceae bacterium]